MLRLRRLLPVIMFLPTSAWAVLLFDNGSPVEQDLGMRYNYAQYTIYDDFTITDRSVITGLGWSQYDEDLTYLGSTISFLSALNAAPLITFDVTASRVANGLNGVPFPGKVSGPVTGYDYFAFLGFFLNPGTYFVGIHNEVSGGQTLMANTLGTPQSIFGSYQSISSNVDPTRFEFDNSNFAFQVYGTTCDGFPGGGATGGVFPGGGATGGCYPGYVSVPEPGTLALLGAGLLAIGLSRRRKKV